MILTHNLNVSKFPNIINTFLEYVDDLDMYFMISISKSELDASLSLFIF